MNLSQFSHRSAVRLLTAGILSVPITAFAAAPPHVGTASAQDEPVIVVRDATAESGCTTWKGDPANVQPCPAGSVIWSYPVARSAAEQAHLAYVIPTSDAGATARAVAAKAEIVHSATVVGAPNVASSASAQQYRTTAAARALGVSPNVASSTGGQYKNQDGNAISYWVGWNSAGGGNITGIVSSSKMYGCCTGWEQDQLGQGMVIFNRNCMPLSGTWTPNQGLPGTYGGGIQYENDTVIGCGGLFGRAADGYTNLGF